MGVHPHVRCCRTTNRPGPAKRNAVPRPCGCPLPDPTTPATGFQAELFEPAGAGNGAAAVVAYGPEGMTTNLSGPWGTMVREFADRLAVNGLTVLIPDYLAVTGTHPAPDVWLQIGAHGDTW
jgi:dienelactone hydrolase